MSDGLSALRLLVIDDNAQMRIIIGSVLAGAGVAQIYYAPTGEEALRMLKHTQIDVAFVDFDMPKVNGLDFISAVRGSGAVYATLPIIMLTGHADLKRLAAARDRGVTEFLRKPVTARSILDRLNSAIFHPRPFVRCDSYFGPDRRRKRTTPYEGPERRASAG